MKRGERVVVMLATEKEGVLKEKAASTTFLHPSSRTAFLEHLTLLEKRNLLICKKRLERLNQFLALCKNVIAESRE